MVVLCYFKSIYLPDYYADMNDLHVDSVTKNYGLKQVLTDVFISCKKDEIIGLLGRNGSGKSTLLKIIFGSISADYKFVRIGKQQLEGVHDNRKLVKYLPQFNFLPDHLKISKIIALFCDKSNSERFKSDKHISPFLDKCVKQLSGGERRLLEIMLIIHSDADYILLDEPFNGVAPLYREEIKNLIKQYSGSKGFIVTDHDYRNILDIATKTILVHDGGTREIKDKKELVLFGYVHLF